MTPANLDLAIVRGCTFGPVLILCKDSEGAAVNITGWSVFAEVRKERLGSLRFSLDPVITDAAAGTISLFFSDEATWELPHGDFAWDLILERPSGERLGRYVAGRCVVSTPITLPPNS